MTGPLFKKTVPDIVARQGALARQHELDVEEEERQDAVNFEEIYNEVMWDHHKYGGD